MSKPINVTEADFEELVENSSIIKILVDVLNGTISSPLNNAADNLLLYGFQSRSLLCWLTSEEKVNNFIFPSKFFHVNFGDLSFIYPNQNLSVVIHLVFYCTVCKNQSIFFLSLHSF